MPNEFDAANRKKEQVAHDEMRAKKIELDELIRERLNDPNVRFLLILQKVEMMQGAALQPERKLITDIGGNMPRAFTPQILRFIADKLEARVIAEN